MEREKTAVEWLVEQLTEVDHGCINKTFLQNSKTLAGRKLKELFQQAKQMEKEQIESSWYDGKYNSYQGDTMEQYYESKYGKDE